jgi:hypothetical protein
MSGTSGLDREPDDVVGRAGYPAPVVNVRLAEIIAYQVVDDEDEPILVVSDGETSVEFSCGLSGLSGSAVRGARGLADAMKDYAIALEAGLHR